MPEVGSALAVNFSLVGNGERIFRNQIERGVGAAAVTKNDVQAAIEAVFVGVLCPISVTPNTNNSAKNVYLTCIASP